jgi:hypothetical protein
MNENLLNLTIICILYIPFFILICLNIRYLCFHGPSRENVKGNESAMTRFTLSGTERLGQTVYEGLGTEN